VLGSSKVNLPENQCENDVTCIDNKKSTDILCVCVCLCMRVRMHVHAYVY
jgi:hypothetical protein